MGVMMRTNDDYVSLMLDYATGSAPEPVAMALAAHVELNPKAATLYSKFNVLGGALLSDVEPAMVSDAGLASVLARLDREPVEAAPLRRSSVGSTPVSLQRYVGNDLDALAWKALTPSVHEFVIPTSAAGYRVSLLRIAPGKAMPTHTHTGEEITVVLEGAYNDASGRFARGDIELADQSIEHKPLADAKVGCTCLAVLSAPLKVSGMMGWFVNPFLRY
jgi:putative transcriptional regulator